MISHDISDSDRQLSVNYFIVRRPENMIAWRIIAFLALAHSIRGGADLDVFKQLLDCYRKAISHGIPNIGLSSYNPLILSQEIGFSGPILEANVSLRVRDIVSYGIPHYEIRTLDQASRDSDHSAIFDYDFHWESLDISMNYELEYDIGLMKYSYEGQIYLNGTDIDWIGEISFDKPVDAGYGQLNFMSVRWEVDNIDGRVVGLGEFDDWAAELISSTLKTSLNFMSDIGLELALIDRVNNFWLTNSTRMDMLLDWCEDN